MSIDLSRLENVLQRCDKVIARCPACAEQNHDEKGEHLVIWPSGKFGCVASPGAAGRDHRKRILALAGDLATRRRGACLIRVRRPVLPPSPFTGKALDMTHLGKVTLPPTPESQEIAEIVDGVGRIGRVSQTLALREHPPIIRDGVTKNPEIPMRSVALKASKASNPSTGDPLSDAAIAMFSGLSYHTSQAIDPETGYPIINGAICPF